VSIADRGLAIADSSGDGRLAQWAIHWCNERIGMDNAPISDHPMNRSIGNWQSAMDT
jgi:hypothetical protein